MKKIQFLSFAVLLLTATSCLKDSVNQPNPTQGGSENEVKGVYFSKGKGPYLAGVKSAVELSSLPQVWLHLLYRLHLLILTWP